MRWFQFEPTYVLHFSNAYEEGDEVVLEGYHQGVPLPVRQPDDTPISMFMRSLDMYAMKTKRHRWRMNTKTGVAREESCDDECSEFPTIHSGFGGKKHRYVYATLGEPGMFQFNGFVKTDVETGKKTTYALPKNVFASEAPFIPRIGAVEEDDGYLVTLTIDMNRDVSECVLFDARAIDRGPIARIALPMRVSSGTHATWAPRG